MDLTSLMSSLLSDDTLTNVSEKSGTSAMDTASVIAAVLPTLLSGAHAQAANTDTAASFEQAAAEHAGRKDEVSLEEGEKIVNHLLGAQAEKTENNIARSTGLSKAKVILILAAAAPLLMKLLGSNSSSSNASSGYYGNTGSLLGSLLGGNSMNSSSSLGTNSLMSAALGSVLSGAMSGGNSYSSNNSLLGSLLGSTMQQPTVTTHTIQPAASASSSSLLGSLLGASMGSSSTQQSGGGLTDLLTSLLM